MVQNIKREDRNKVRILGGLPIKCKQCMEDTDMRKFYLHLQEEQKTEWVRSTQINCLKHI